MTQDVKRSSEPGLQSAPQSSVALFTEAGRCATDGPSTFRHFPQLDGLRGLAILLVVTSHILNYGFGITHGELGTLGVMLFFVLSGLLITGLLDRERIETGDIAVGNFYMRRMLRLFPALLCFLVVLSVLIRWKAVQDTTWYSIAACLLYVRNIWGHGDSNGHLWSLSLEEQFYVFWPSIMRRLKRTTALRIAIAGVACITAFRMTAIHFSWFDYNSGVYYLRSWFRFDSILIGCAAGLLLFQPGGPGSYWTLLSGKIVSLIVWPAAVLWSVWGETISREWYLTLQTILAVIIVVNLVLTKSTAYVAIFSNPVTSWFCRISYSWYLWQQLFLAFPARSWPVVRTFPYNLIVVLLLAMLSRRWIEVPFLRMKRRYAAPRPRLCWGARTDVGTTQ